MENVMKDDRFAHIASDPKFWQVPIHRKKINVDNRFNKMFKDNNFSTGASAKDKRGRPMNAVIKKRETLDRYYEKEGGNVKAHQKNITPKQTKSKNEQTSKVGDADELEDGSGEEDVASSEEEDEEELSSSSDDDSSSSSEESAEEEQFDPIALAEADKIARKTMSPSTALSVNATGRKSGGVAAFFGTELDQDATMLDAPSKRIAFMHLDWDRIKAVDIWTLVRSFLSGGENSDDRKLSTANDVNLVVTIYPSQFGLSRMKDDNAMGPIELRDIPAGEIEKAKRLRTYQLNRLRYYYAVVEFDCVEHAQKVYSELDGWEYEGSSITLDLRYIDDSVSFESDPVHDRCSEPPPPGFKPIFGFINSALQRTTCQLTWDENDHQRGRAMSNVVLAKTQTRANRRKANKNKEDPEEDVAVASAFLATPSASEDENEIMQDDDSNADDDQDNPKRNNFKSDVFSTVSKADRYRAMIEEIEENEAREKRRKQRLLSGKSADDDEEEFDDGNLQDDDFFNPDNLNVGKTKKGSKAKKDEEWFDCESGSDDDEKPIFSKKKVKKLKETTTHGNKQRKKEGDEPEEKVPLNADELALLLMDDTPGKSEEKKHFKLKNLLVSDKKRKKSQEDTSQPERKFGKKQLKKRKLSDNNTDFSSTAKDSFKMDFEDNRFGAIFSSHLYNIDPSAPEFKKTAVMQDFITQKAKKRRNEIEKPSSSTAQNDATQDTPSHSANKDDDLLIKKLRDKMAPSASKDLSTRKPSQNFQLSADKKEKLREHLPKQ